MSIYTDMRQIQGLTCAKRVRTSRLLKNSSSKGIFEGSPKGEM